MKRFIKIIQRESGLASGEAIVVSAVLVLLLIGWIGKSISPDHPTHEVEQADKVIELLDSLLKQATPAPSYQKPATDSSSKASKRTQSSKRQRRPKSATTAVVVPVNINTASQTQLELLPGVGPATARRIIEERLTRPFSSIDDIERVKGIGPAKLAKMRPYITAP